MAILSSVRYLGYMSRQIGCIIIGILIPVYVSKVDFSIPSFFFFLIGSSSLQFLVTILMQRTLFITFGAPLPASQRRAMLFQASSMTGILNFKYAFGTKNDLLITFVGLLFASSILFHLTLSVYLISSKNCLYPTDNDQVQSIPADSARSSYFSDLEDKSEDAAPLACTKLKAWLITFHEDTLTPILIRQRTERDMDESEQASEDGIDIKTKQQFSADTRESLMVADDLSPAPRENELLSQDTMDTELTLLKNMKSGNKS